MGWPHFRIRTLMAAVAAVAVVIGTSITVYRYCVLRETYLRLASGQEAQLKALFRDPESTRYWEARWQAQFSRENMPGKWFTPGYPWPAAPPFVPAMAAYHEQMRTKWLYAADRPWLPVAPDPWPRN